MTQTPPVSDANRLNECEWARDAACFAPPVTAVLGFLLRTALNGTTAPLSSRNAGVKVVCTDNSSISETSAG